MPYDPRTIGFACELLHPPRPVDLGRAQRLHGRMFERGGTPYPSFSVAAGGCVLSAPAVRQGVVSALDVLGDRIRFREEQTGHTVDDFADRVRTVAEEAAEVLAIPVFTARAVTVRSLVSPRRHSDGRSFVRDGLLAGGAELAVLGREPAILGVRLVFTPTQEEASLVQLRVESFAADPRSVMLEVQGTYGPLPAAQGLGKVEESIRAAYGFLAERATAFFARADAREGGA